MKDESKNGNVNCPIHGEGENGVAYLPNGADLWGERVCMKCLAEVAIDAVRQKQKEFVDYKSSEEGQ